jgi:hypothetical protein
MIMIQGYSEKESLCYPLAAAAVAVVAAGFTHVSYNNSRDYLRSRVQSRRIHCYIDRSQLY